MGHLIQERPLKHEARICQQVILEGVVEVTFMDVTMVIHPHVCWDISINPTTMVMHPLLTGTALPSSKSLVKTAKVITVSIGSCGGCSEETVAAEVPEEAMVPVEKDVPEEKTLPKKNTNLNKFQHDLLVRDDDEHPFDHDLSVSENVVYPQYIGILNRVHLRF